MKVKIIIAIIISLAIGFSGGYFFFYPHQQTIAGAGSTQDCEHNYRYINTGLGCQPSPAIHKHEYTTFVEQLQQYITKQTQQKRAIQISVYFRDLYAGPTFGIGGDARFAPASLLKLPLLMTYYSLEEQNSGVLTKKISYTNTNEKIPPQTENTNIPVLEQNKPYTIDELLSRMIIYSDNVSYYVLDDFLAEAFPSQNPLTQTMVDLGIVNPRNPNEDTITVKAYASLFRQLFNSSYLSPQLSEKALQLLSKSTYTNGLVAGVPAEIKVSHKYGERSGLPNNEKQLHDCGIVYYPGNPYLLCIMTRGNDFVALQAIIKTISADVYQEVDSRKY
jgi:beta-lactamase class A